MANYADFQLGIYLAGLGGEKPALPVSFQEVEAAAHAVMDPELLDYVAGGAGDERTQSANVDAFHRWGLVPRMLAGAAERDLSVDLFGLTLPTPIFMCPIGVLGVMTEDQHGDLAAAHLEVDALERPRHAVGLGDVHRAQDDVAVLVGGGGRHGLDGPGAHQPTSTETGCTLTGLARGTVAPVAWTPTAPSTVTWRPSRLPGSCTEDSIWASISFFSSSPTYW